MKNLWWKKRIMKNRNIANCFGWSPFNFGLENEAWNFFGNDYLRNFRLKRFTAEGVIVVIGCFFCQFLAQMAFSVTVHLGFVLIFAKHGNDIVIIHDIVHYRPQRFQQHYQKGDYENSIFHTVKLRCKTGNIKWFSSYISIPVPKKTGSIKISIENYKILKICQLFDVNKFLYYW